MKKVLIVVAVILLAFFLFVYLYIPSRFEFQVAKFAAVNPSAASRILFAENNWHNWWPEQDEKHKTDSVFHYKGASFTIDRQLYNAFKIDIVKKKDTLHSLFSLIPTSADTTQLLWSVILNTSPNPFKRLNKYRAANETKKEMEAIISSLQAFLQNQENVYGMRIRREIVQDTLLAFKEQVSNVDPSTEAIYEMVNELKDQIRKGGANETNPPMMNVIQLAPGKYRVMVAIPVNRTFVLADSVSFRRMVRGWILVSDIQGGPSRINRARIEMRNFVNDYSKIPIALPFESLITNRMVQQDTSKWVTRLYFPIVL